MRGSTCEVKKYDDLLSFHSLLPFYMNQVIIIEAITVINDDLINSIGISFVNQNILFNVMILLDVNYI